jgi:RNA polymerase sigma factor (sigma-70 family)
MDRRGYGYRMRDSELVAAVVAGDPEGLAEAYDKYSGPLYTYCRSLLREPADAADAVQDTFVIAASRLGGLRDRERLRPWLYAVARNECRRRIREKAATTTLEEAPDVTDETADIGGGAERAELRALLREAVGGLNPAEQEVVELQLRQGLDPAEVADVLGISRNHAHALISRARDQLEICLGVLLVARSRRDECDALNTLLEGWDGQLTVLLRKRLNRHIERCPVCSDRRRTVLAPAMLLGLAPLAAVAVSVTAPDGLRDQVIRLASSDTPEAVAHRATVAGRTGPFSEHGFPKPLDPPKVSRWQSRPVQAAAGAAAVAAIAVVAVAIVGGDHSHNTASGTSPTVGTTAPGGQPGASGGQPGASGGPSPGASGRPGSGSSGLPGPGGTGSPGVPVTIPVGASSPGTSPATGQPTTAQPTTGQPTTPSSSGSTPPTTSPTTSPAPKPSPSPSPAPPTPPPVAAGTLSVSPTTVLLSTLDGSTLTISAVNGPVSWSISEPSSLIGKVDAAPASGTLQAGQQATITLTVDGIASVDSNLTLNPGGISVTVVLGLL